jgi:tRNA-Thr(GGU) m(6)t(6)A37 methyltransferase TsaA
MDDLRLRPVGVIRTGHRSPVGMPIQAAEAAGERGRVDLDPAWLGGLADLDGFDRVWLLWWADRARPGTPCVTPFRDAGERGVFATRSPARPNPIGLSCVRLLAVDAAGLEFAGADMLDGTPLLDIKPYVWGWDAFPGVRSGWYDTAARPEARSDARFAGSAGPNP